MFVFYSCCDPSTVVFFLCVTWRGFVFSPLGRVGWTATLSCHFLRVFFSQLCSFGSWGRFSLQRHVTERKVTLKSSDASNNSTVFVSANQQRRRWLRPPLVAVTNLQLPASVRLLLCRRFAGSAAVWLFLLAISLSVNFFHLIEKILNQEGRSEGVKQFVLFVFPE